MRFQMRIATRVLLLAGLIGSFSLAASAHHGWGGYETKEFAFGLSLVRCSPRLPPLAPLRFGAPPGSVLEFAGACNCNLLG